MMEENASQEQEDETMTAQEKWQADEIGAVVNHIRLEYHAAFEKELPRISEWLSIILRVHGSTHPELEQVQSLFLSLKERVESYITMGETTLYRAIEEEQLHNVCNTIFNLDKEQRLLKQNLQQIQEVTKGYAIPEDACTTFATTYKKLEALSDKILELIELENTSIFPRVTKRKGQEKNH